MWFEIYDNIVFTARFLVEVRGSDPDELISFLEKPWKYEDEFNAATARHEGRLCVECDEAPGEKRATQKDRVLCAKCLEALEYDDAVSQEMKAAPVTAEQIFEAVDEIVRSR